MAEGLRALIVNRTLKPSPGTSNTEALASVVGEALLEREHAGARAHGRPHLRDRRGR